MSKFAYLIACITCLLIISTSCRNQKSDKIENEVPTEEEKAQAVKDILKQGVEKATAILSAENGFLADDSLKITLPEEAQNLIKNIKKLPKGEELLNKVIIQVNQAAGNSISAITPIINTAIDSMSIEEANRILAADNAAATAYLEKIMREPLHTACEPIIIQSMDKDMYGLSTRSTWNNLIDMYNDMANSGIGKIANIEPVDVALDDVVTKKILDALFYLIAKEEMSIRKHPGTRISKSVAKSFGWID